MHACICNGKRPRTLYSILKMINEKKRNVHVLCRNWDLNFCYCSLLYCLYSLEQPYHFFFLLIKFGEIKERKNFHASSLGLNPRLRLKIVKILWPIVLRGLLLFGLSNLIYDYGKYPLFQGIAFENLWNLSFEQWLKEIFFCPSNCCQYILLLYDDNTRRSFLFCCNLTFSWTEQVDLSLN